VKLNDYQEQAAKTIVTHDGVTDPLVIPLLGLVGEAGELLSEYKRKLRDRDAHELFVDVIREELGDILWYTSDIATKFGLGLEDIAQANLDKLRDRYLAETRTDTFFDERLPPEERIPRTFEVCFYQKKLGKRARLRMFKEDGAQIGDELTDNAYTDDGYRFHDIFHFSYATHLGWSPVTRKFLRRKRASNGDLDEIEDGGRAWVFEEAISALVFQHARRMRYFEGVRRVDGRLLKEIKSLTSGIEVRIRSKLAWEEAILGGYDIWRKVRDHRGGWVSCDLIHKKMKFRPCTSEDLANFARRTDELELVETGDIEPIASHVV
jgi:NTP pyrophosphatase (non-canonical NTP hydrolase)